MTENKKHVFWQALFLTILFFLLGLVFGVYMEQLRADGVSVAFYQSEVSLYDSFALGKLFESNLTSCADLKEATTRFADKIYSEARQLEKYDTKSELTDSMKTIHRKYDLLRTLLWMNALEIKQKCGELNTAVYLYNYGTEDIEIKSKQNVFGKILNDLKNEKGGDVLLIPIAANQEIESLSYLTRKYNLSELPVIFVNEKKAFYEPASSDEIGKYLD
ncbi:hypothetical protein HY449_01695 [Candidatus Pacearchaeota archaeon]|nr:hypothetical protein [Candidatus Pacearchaeota archaeon]